MGFLKVRSGLEIPFFRNSNTCKSNHIIILGNSNKALFLRNKLTYVAYDFFSWERSRNKQGRLFVMCIVHYRESNLCEAQGCAAAVQLLICLFLSFCYASCAWKPSAACSALCLNDISYSSKRITVFDLTSFGLLFSSRKKRSEFYNGLNSLFSSFVVQNWQLKLLVLHFMVAFQL